MRRGEIAIGVVIVIALGLIVLVTLAIALTGGFDDLEGTTGACTDTYGGSCTTQQACQAQGGRVVGSGSCAGSFTTQYDNSWTVQSYPLGGGVCCVT